MVILLPLIALLPILAALVGYGVRRRGNAAGVLGLLGLLAAAAVSAWVLLTTPVDNSAPPFRLAVLRLPEAGQVPPPPPAAETEQRAEYFAQFDAFMAQQPAQLTIPLQFVARRQGLSFALSCALLAALCLLFALRERRDDPRRGQFFATLTLFSGAMLLLLTADTLLLIYIAWELMGLCSFLLIAHNGSLRALRAAREAFWTTRATDFGLLFAVLILLGRFNWPTLSSISVNGILGQLQQLQAQNPAFDAAATAATQVFPWLTAVALLVLFATVGKLALFPLSFWLPEAMVAPTPVSALLHAATMVAAGPYLLTQLGAFFQYSEIAMLAAVLVGGVSLVLAGLMALAARDAKRVLAYSTISQLALPVLGVGVLANTASFYQVLAHAWFKAPLFLAVGYLAVAASRHTGGAQHVADHSGSERDPDDHTLLDRLRGAARHSAVARWTLLLAGASLAGVLGTAGYMGKEQILLALLTRWRQELAPEVTFGSTYPLAAAAWTIGSVLVVLSIPITAAYTVRLIGLLGWGKSAAGAEHTLDPQSTNTSSGVDQQVRPELDVTLTQLPAGSVDPPQAAQPPKRTERVLGPYGQHRSWSPALVLSLLAAFIGSIGLGALLPQLRGYLTPPDELWRWAEGGGFHVVVTAVDVLLVLGAGYFTWRFNVARPDEGARAVREGRLQPLIALLDNGLNLRWFWNTVIGYGGALLSLRADRFERRALDRLVMNTARDGRRLARLADWVDRHVVDGLRYWAAEVWWVLKRVHQRLLQTGSIQHYMFVILLSAVILCFVVLPPLARAFGEILGRL
jgi:NADH:ubiquinone oxidoreductase subunit 5 (subunit L)/multisubunit Na+/H+ antiporter MnhA subunit